MHTADCCREQTGSLVCHITSRPIFCSSFLPSNECNDLQFVFSLYSEIVSKASYKVSADLCSRRHCLTCALTRRDVARLAQQVASLGGGWQHLGSIQQEVKAGKTWKKKLWLYPMIYTTTLARDCLHALWHAPLVRLVDLDVEDNWGNCHHAEHIEIWATNIYKPCRCPLPAI